MTFQVSWLAFLEFVCYMMIFGFMWRTLSIKLSEKPIGKAMSYIYG